MRATIGQIRPTLAGTRRFLKQAVTERLGLKLTAFVIAVLLLVLVRFQEESERFFFLLLDDEIPSCRSPRAVW